MGRYEQMMIELEELAFGEFMKPVIYGPTKWVRSGDEDLGGGLVPMEDGEETDGLEVVEGYGARFSAPGFMDATEWQVFDTFDEAYEYLMDELLESYAGVEDAEIERRVKRFCEFMGIEE